LVPGGGAQGLCRETTENLPHGDGPGRAILFGQSHKESTTQPRGDVAVGLAPDKQVDDIAQMIKNLVGRGRPQGFLEVQRPQAGGTSARVPVERRNRRSDVVRSDSRHEADVGSTQAREVRNLSRRVLSRHLSPHGVGVQETRGIEGLTSLGVGTLPA
jgi:hypothetical protein